MLYLPEGVPVGFFQQKIKAIKVDERRIWVVHPIDSRGWDILLTVDENFLHLCIMVMQ
jgi:hypothetical protein